MGIEDINLKALFSKIDLNRNNTIKQSEIDAFKKANPAVPLNGVKAGMVVGDAMDGLQIERTGKADEEVKMPASQSSNTANNDNGTVFKKEAYSPYYRSFPATKVNSYEELKQGSHEDIKDARNCDISSLNLTNEQLHNLCIDNSTVLSDEQRKIVTEYTEKMKDPGLGIRQLHQQGLTGKGVKIAIIDMPLGEHEEYSQNLIHLEDINSKEMGWTNAEMHSAAVASIAVGKNIGVAPDADLVYYSTANLSYDPKDIEIYHQNIWAKIEELKHRPDSEEKIKVLEEMLQPNENILQEIESMKASLSTITNQEKLDMMKEQIVEMDNYANSVTSNRAHVEALQKILDQNKKLPDDEKISVVSISWGFDPLAPGYDELLETVERAKKEGVFIVSTALSNHYGMETCGANRDPQADPNEADSYEACAFWKRTSEMPMSPNYRKRDSLLLVPMDHRTVADFTSKDGYRYEGNDGGMSWSTPWLAGMYVLAKQADPAITPEIFWQKALETSDECKNNDTDAYVGRLINPQKLINAIIK